MPDFSRGDIIAMVAAQLLSEQGEPSQEAIDLAIKQAMKIVKSAHAAASPAAAAKPQPQPPEKPGPARVSIPKYKALAEEHEANKRIGRGRTP
jgi:hypothetical protein